MVETMLRVVRGDNVLYESHIPHGFEVEMTEAEKKNDADQVVEFAHTITIAPTAEAQEQIDELEASPAEEQAEQLADIAEAQEGDSEVEVVEGEGEAPAESEDVEPGSLEALSLVELQDLAVENDVAKSGTKAEIIERLRAVGVE